MNRLTRAWSALLAYRSQRPIPDTKTHDLPEPRAVTDVELLEAELDAVYDGAEQWRDRCIGAEQLLFVLLKLHDRKEKVGKDEYYQDRQPAAWKLTYQHLKLHGHDVTQITPP